MTTPNIYLLTKEHVSVAEFDGSGYLPTKDYWRLGTIFGAIFLAALLLIGYPWMSMMF